ncbi:MAG: acyltransferase family protein [Caldilineaceae bacterium]
MIALPNQLATKGQITTQAQAKTRMAYLDNLRIYLTILVILHHAAIAYGGAGDWPVKDPAVDKVSPMLLAIFNAVNQAYFMSAFFLLAGYFTPRALANKGVKQFINDRLLRLGVPLLLYTTLVVNLNKLLLDVYYRKVAYQPFIGYSAGHLWFVQALLLFAGIYVVYWVIAKPGGARTKAAISPSAFPSDGHLLGWIGGLALLTFVVRLRFPVGVWLWEMQLGHFVHYVFAFGAGILAYHHDWLNQLTGAQARRWGISACAAVPLFVILVGLAGALDNGANVAKLLGGWHWEALAFALWEAWLMIALIVFLLYLLRAKFNTAGPLTRMMAANAYTVYLIHQTVLIALNIALLSTPIPTIVKFFLASAMTILVCFGLSGLIRRIPGAERVLG